ncbi:hypothetical protein [Bacillus wiedmannii]|uniref:hypothetical protein n=1 Tax=Bacillus wiedmannii TaxID=1890302 RepID=UPI000BFE720B|nr:hypothetical protein [Bacillus wiedmannii]PHF09292.1 hypothetical protein COF74_10895 [Bacillus wiedmannii]
MEQFFNDLSQGFNLFFGFAIFFVFVITVLSWHGRKAKSNAKWVELTEVLLTMLASAVAGITVLITVFTGKGVLLTFIALIAFGIGAFNAGKKFLDLYKKESLPNEETSVVSKTEEKAEPTEEIEEPQPETVQVEKQENKDLKM